MDFDLLKCFPDKSPRMQSRIAEIIDILSRDPRMPITRMADQLDMPVTTTYDYVSLVLERLHLQTLFIPRPAVVPKPTFRCPKCKSDNTEPQRTHNPVTEKVKITGARCKDCGCDIRRGQLSPILLKRMEG